MNLNTYEHQFISACPENGKPIIYSLRIESVKMIYVEKIMVACALWQTAHHEKIADALAQQFPGTRQILKAHHHGVDLTTERGEL